MKPLTPDELDAAPELGPLAIAAAAAEISRSALLSAHPELACGDYLVEYPIVTPRECLAAAAIAALDALIDAVEHYAAHVDALASQLHTSPRGESDDTSF